MTPKEALKWLFIKASKQHCQLWAIKLTKSYGQRKNLVDEITSDLDNHSGELNDTFHSVYKSLTELEELKRDVKRFFELKNNITNREEMDEFWEIDKKLSKVGKEE